MNTLIIDSKEYVVLPIDEYEELTLKAAANTTSLRRYSLTQGKKKTLALIEKWSKEK